MTNITIIPSTEHTDRNETWFSSFSSREEVTNNYSYSITNPETETTQTFHDNIPKYNETTINQDPVNNTADEIEILATVPYKSNGYTEQTTDINYEIITNTSRVVDIFFNNTRHLHTSESNQDSTNLIQNVTHIFFSEDTTISNTPVWNVDENVTLGNDFTHNVQWHIENGVVNWETVFKVISLSVFIFTGVFGNILVICTVIKERRLHRPPFYYFISLSVSDFSRAIFCLPFILTSVLRGSRWTHGESACILLAFANAFFIYSSIYALLAISIDRHLAILHTKFHRRRTGGLLNLVVVVIGWIIAFAMSFPPVFGLGTYRFHKSEAQCTFHHRYYDINDTLGFVLVFTFLIVAAIFLYTRVFMFLRSHRKMRPLVFTPARSNNWTFLGPGANGQAMVNLLNGFIGRPLRTGTNALPMIPQTFGRVVNLRTAHNEHLTKTFFLLTVTFDLLWLPYVILSYMQIFSLNVNISPAMFTFAAWMSYLQVSLNPIVYACAKGPFRMAIRAGNNSYHQKEMEKE